MIATDVHYARLLSPRLDLFKYKGSNLFNFRCPICGDSDRDKHKARAYLYPKGSGLNYRCHNCQASMKFSTFLREYFPDVYQEYSMEMYKGKYKIQEDTPTVSKPSQYFELPDNLERISNLPTDHPAVQYILSRQIPQKEHFDIYYTENFHALVRQYHPEKKVSPHPRIVLPFYDRNRNLMGFQGRALPSNYNDIRYITIKMDENLPKIYGLHRIGSSPEIVYVVEGPFDSLFLDNSVAMMGSDINHDTIVDLTGCDNIVYVFDNERRNRQIISKMVKTVTDGHKIVVWPKTIGEKDLNDMILSGLTRDDILSIIQRNTNQGMTAQMNLSMWSKVGTPK